MQNVIAVLKAIGILLGTWAVLGVVGLATGSLPAFPEFGGSLANHHAGSDAGVDGDGPNGGNDGGSDDGSSAGDAGVPGQDGTAHQTDGTVEPDTDGSNGPPQGEDDATAANLATNADATDAAPSGSAPEAQPGSPSAHSTICVGAEPTVTPISDRVLVGCGADVDLLAQWDSPALARIARFTRTPTRQGDDTSATVLAAGDINGDGRPDLVLGFTDTRSVGAPSGALYVAASAPGGGFKAPEALAPIVTRSLDVASLNGQEGADLAALHQPGRGGSRATEAWLFGGGSAPARSARLDAGSGATLLATADLDRDGKRDVVTLGAAVRVHFGDGRGRAPQFAEVTAAEGTELTGARETLVVDVDHDGGDDVLVVGRGLYIIRAGRRDALTVAAIPGTPDDLRSLRAVDVDGDGKLDLVGVSGDGIVWLRHIEGLAFELAVLHDLPLRLGVPRRVWAHRSETTTATTAEAATESSDAPGEVAAATPSEVSYWVLTRRDGNGSEANWSLLRFTGALPPDSAFGEPRSVRDAPLSLSFSLR